MLFQTATYPTGLSSRKPESGPPHHTKNSSVRTKGIKGNQMDRESKKSTGFQERGSIKGEKKRDKKEKQLPKRFFFSVLSVCMLMFILANSWGREEEPEKHGVSGFTVTCHRRCRHGAQPYFFWQRGIGTVCFLFWRDAVSPVP